MKIHEIFLECLRRKLVLRPDGDTLRVSHRGGLDSEFAAVLTKHKPVLLRLLRAKHHLVRQVLAGEFDGSNHDMHLQLSRELFEVSNHPLTQAAWRQLAKQIETHHEP